MAVGRWRAGGASIASAIADSGPNAGPSARGGPAIVPHPRNPAPGHAGHAHGDIRAAVVQTESDLGWAQYDLPERADSAAGVMRLLGQYPNYCGGGKAATRSLPSRSLPGETAPSLVRRMVQGRQEAMGRSGRFAHASGDSGHQPGAVGGGPGSRRRDGPVGGDGQSGRWASRGRWASGGDGPVGGDRASGGDGAESRGVRASHGDTERGRVPRGRVPRGRGPEARPERGGAFLVSCRGAAIAAVCSARPPRDAHRSGPARAGTCRPRAR